MSFRFRAKRPIARLLRARHSLSCAASAALSQPTGDEGFPAAIPQMLDELGTELALEP